MKIDKTESRCYTNALLEMVEEGLIDANYLVLCCLKYMSEDDVEEMSRINDLIDEDDEDEDDEEDEETDD